MEETEDMLDLDFWSEALYLQTDCNDLDCPPPLFDLPPPPRPPWLDPEDESCSESSEYESCENIVIIDSQAHLEETFHNLIIIAVCSAILVILLVFLIACIWRWRYFRSGPCHCGVKPGHHPCHLQDCVHQGRGHAPGQSLELSDAPLGAGHVGSYKEVYDNPNYTHIMIGGQPFFILPSGELSDHVPVPSNSVQVTPRKMTTGQHIYEGGSSTYRSTSDYDTDSSSYRPDSDRASSGHHQPIYEEIDKELDSQLPRMSPINTIAVINNLESGSPHSVHTRLERPQHPWSSSSSSTPAPSWSNTSHKSLSPRRPSGMAKAGGNSNSIYYYSDTLRGRKTGDRDLTESDSGISSESTPHHLPSSNRIRKHCDQGNETNSENVSSYVQTQVFLTNLSTRDRQNIAKL